MKLYQLFKSEMGNKIYFIVVLAICSGVSNILLLKTISEMLTGEAKQAQLYQYAILLVCFFVITRTFSLFLLKMGLRSTVLIRKTLVNTIGKTNFNRFSALGKDKILSSLTTDTTTLSNAPGNLIDIITSLTTILASFFYLGSLSITALASLIVFILVGIALYEYMVRGAMKDWTKARDVNDSFFKYVEDFLHGFKELSINGLKRLNFINNDLLSVVEEEYKYRYKGGKRLVNAYVISSSFIYIVLGLFIFTMLFLFETKTETMIAYIFVMLYLIGPLQIIQGGYQTVVEIEIAAEKILNLFNEMKIDPETLDVNEVNKLSVIETVPEFHSLDFVDVEFKYNQDDSFFVGPLNFRIEPSEIIFIAGGNGSGKTTLIQLLLGMHTPDSGKILLNNKTPIHSRIEEYLNLYAVIFSDFYLFETLHGLKEKVDPEDIDYLLDKLKLKGKTDVKENSFTTVQLSQGQRKRVALLTSYLEDKQIYIFDEFAADQDPEFREYFYKNILPELKAAGKTVIAITHDDKYYECCDTFIKMDYGQMVEYKSHIEKTITA